MNPEGVLAYSDQFRIGPGAITITESKATKQGKEKSGELWM